MVKGLLVINLFLWNNCSLITIPANCREKGKTRVPWKTYRCNAHINYFLYLYIIFFSAINDIFQGLLNSFTIYQYSRILILNDLYEEIFT